jgi:hypothetical protein
VPQTGVEGSCGCGEPSTPGTVHRTDGPCYVDEFSYEERERTGRNAGLCIHPDGYDGECPCPPSCGCCKVAAQTTPDNSATGSDTADSTALREQYAAAMREHYLCTSRDEADADGNLPCRCGDWREPGPMGSDEDDWDSHIAAAALAVRDREMEQLREQLAARDTALATYTAQLVRDQQRLAAAKKCARGIGAWGVLQAIDNASAPAPDSGPTVAEAAADDKRWSLQKDGE